MRVVLVLLMIASWGMAAEVRIPSGGESIKGELYLPKVAGPRPAVVVIHEWWGLNDWVKEQAERLAGAGYVALAVDLYRGQVATEADHAHELMRGMPLDRAIRDLRAAVTFLAARSNVRKDKIASIGWCMGGGLSLQLSLNEPTIATTVMWYGSVVTDPEAIQKVHAPVLGIFGEEDRGIPVDGVRQFEQQMKAARKDIEVHIYPNAGHAFANPEGSGYRPQATTDAWDKTLAFLKRTLG